MVNLEFCPDILKKDIEGGLCLLKHSKKRTSDNHGRVYAKTNERTDLYFPMLELQNESLLTVEASGDHFLQGVLEGANSITTFDINPLTYYVAALKRAGIEELSLSEYKKYFDMKISKVFELMSDKPRISYSEDIYIQLRKSLTPQVREFWDNMYHKGKLAEKYESFFLPGFIMPGDQPNSYLNSNNYPIVKNRIKEVNHQFISSDLLSLPLTISSDDKYHAVVLSNIYDWFLPNQQGKKYVKFINEKISPLLTENGKCVAYYSFTKADTLFQNNFKASPEMESTMGKTRIYTYSNNKYLNN